MLPTRLLVLVGPLRCVRLYLLLQRRKLLRIPVLRSLLAAASIVPTTTTTCV